MFSMMHAHIVKTLKQCHQHFHYLHSHHSHIYHLFMMIIFEIYWLTNSDVLDALAEPIDCAMQSLT